MPIRSVRRIVAVLAVSAAAWACALWILGGANIRWAGLTITSNDPYRPGLAAAILAVAYLLLSRTAGLREDGQVAARHLSVTRVAATLTVVSTAVGLWSNATTAGGADSYSYVAHAETWLAGALKTPMPLAASAPWPGALDTLTPLGFHPSYDDNTIVPVTSPGVPLLMAAFNLLAGHCAMFWVFPLTGALLVWTTFAIGRRVVSPAAGAAASWLVATSPTFVMMSKATMSDVPAAAFWALAVAGLLRRTTTAAWLAGLSASVAILVRSNLLPVGLWLGAWVAWREWRSRDGRWQRPAVFALGAAPGCALIASLNTTLRGSPLASGYGGLDDLFSIAYAAPSIQRYVSWVIETQTVLWIAGALALIVPARRLWRTDDARQAAILLAGVVATVWTGYFFYQPFEAWWFLRFMLPSWPALAIGTSALVLALGDAAGRTGRRCSVGVIVALGLFGAFKTRQLGVFAPGEGERRYATIAELVAQHTEPTAVIFTMQNSGAVRYYAGRLTLRYDMLDPAWLDRTVEWLERSGRHPYFLLEDWEVPAFRQRFAAQNRWGREEMAPVLAYKAHAITGFVFLFDPRRPEGPTNTPPSIRDPKPRCAPPSQTAVH